MQNTLPMDTQRKHSTTLTGPEHPDCPNPGGSCRGCSYSYDPSLFDGGCMIHVPKEERERIKQRNRKSPYAGVYASIPADDPRFL